MAQRHTFEPPKDVKQHNIIKGWGNLDMAGALALHRTQPTAGNFRLIFMAYVSQDFSLALKSAESRRLTWFS